MTAQLERIEASVLSLAATLKGLQMEVASMPAAEAAPGEGETFQEAMYKEYNGSK